MSKLEVRIYQAYDLKIRFPVSTSGLSVVATVESSTQQVSIGNKGASVEFNQALYFTPSNFNGSVNVKVMDLNGSETFQIGQVDIPLSVVASVASATEVKHIYALDQGGEVSVGLIPTHAVVHHDEPEAVLTKTQTIGPYGLGTKKKSERAVIGYAPEDIQRIFPHLARGTYGVVFRGRAKGIPTYVVVKDMEIQNQKSIEEWQKEIAIMAQTKSPYVAEVYGWSSLQNQLTIVMEFMCNGDLFGILHKKQDKHPLSLLLRMRMGRHCALGLQVLHQFKIIHRDVKTMNYLVNENYDVKITDFGCSKMSNDNSIYNTSNVGSPLWMAPEVKMGQYSFSSDIYSLGICLYEIFERKLPEFNGQTQSALLPTQYQSLAVVSPCLNRNPNQRPSIDQVITFLDKLTKKIVSKTRTVLEANDEKEIQVETDKEILSLQQQGHTLPDRIVIEEKNLYNILLNKKELADVLFEKAGFDIGPGKANLPPVPTSFNYHQGESTHNTQLPPLSGSIQNFTGYEKSYESINVGKIKNSGANPNTSGNSPNPILKNSSANNNNNLANSSGGQVGKTISLNQSQPSKPHSKPSKSSKSQELDSSDEEIPSTGGDNGLTSGPRVIVVGARDLKSADSNGLSDPYAKIYCNGRPSKTKTIKKTLNPQWDHVINIKGISKCTLQITLWDWDRIGTDDYLGYCESTFDVTKESDFWLDVVPGSRKKEKNITGQVHVIVKTA